MKTLKITPETIMAGMIAVLLALTGAADRLQAATVVTLDPSASWIGYVNAYNNPSSGNFPANLPGSQTDGIYEGTNLATLPASFSGMTLTLSPNSSITGTGSGTRIVEANFYIDNIGFAANTTLTFSGYVLSNTLALAGNPGNTDSNGNGWTTVAFVKHFDNGGFATFETNTMSLTPGLPFSVSLSIPGSGTSDHVQYGIAIEGPNVSASDSGTFGIVQISSVPEPASIVLLLGSSVLGGFYLLRLKRT